MTEHVDCVIAGAGVIGLAVARALARAGRQVLLLESEGAFGTVTSSRNSEVIHAGLYYEPGSLKAQTCVAGRRALYAYATQRKIGFRKLTKLIVAQTPAELDEIERLHLRGVENGVEGLEMLSRARAQKLEPDLRCVGALLSEETGILNSHDYMQALEADIEAAEGMVVYRAPVMSGQAGNDGVQLQIGGTQAMTLNTDLFINAAGYSAPNLSALISGLPQESIPESRLCKGSYFTMSGKSPFSRLIYPAPTAHGLGVHLTLDLAGQARFGPDTEWVDTPDYDVNPSRAEHFYEKIRAYWPDLPDGSLHPDYAGLRSKIAVDDKLYTDFMIKTPTNHEVPVVALYGIESPGLTASLAIADRVCKLVCD